MRPRRSARIAERNVARAARLAAQNQYGQQNQQVQPGPQPQPQQPQAGQQSSQSQQQQAIHNLESHPSFLGISRELRRKVYQYVLNFEGWVVNTAMHVNERPPWYRRHKRWVSNGFSLLPINKAINEEIWDVLISPWGWPDTHATTIKLPYMACEYWWPPHYGWQRLNEDLLAFLPLAVRDRASTVVLHFGNASTVLYDPRPNVATLFPTACKPLGRFVLWFPRWRIFDQWLHWPLKEILPMIEAMRTLRVGESVSFVWDVQVPVPRDRGSWHYIVPRCIEDQDFNLTFEYPLGPKTMQHLILNDPPGVVTFKTIWRKDSYGGRWYTGRRK